MRTLLFLVLTLVLPSGLSGQYVSRLKGEPVPDLSSFWPFQLEPATAEHLAGLPSQPGDRAFAGILEVLEETDLDARVVLVEPAEGEPFLYVDADLDGILSSRERFAFGEVPGVEGPAVLLRFHVNTAGLPYYPVVLSPAPAGKDGSRGLLRTDSFYLRGTIEVAGREVLVRYPIYAFTGRVELKKGTLGMDLDGDGEIATGLSAGETGRDKGQGVVFPLAGMAISTTRVDAAAGLAELRIHPASDIGGFDLRPGSTVPDFSYTDVDGQPRRLSELRGKLVLLDFWGTWCIPCRQELPDLRKAFAAYRDLGFVILGMDARDELAKLQAFVAEQDVPWLHATADSVEDVIKDGFRVRGYPTKILLDREGRVISAGDPGQPPLIGEGLLKTIEENLPVLASEYVSELKADPVPGPPFMVFDLAPVQRAELPAPPATEDRVYSGSFRLTPDHPELRVVLVEPQQGEPYLYADGDLDGKLTAGERFPLGEVLLEVPPIQPPGRPFPVTLRPIPVPPPEGDEARLMNYSRTASVEGPIQLGMMEMLVRYPVDPRTGLMSLKGEIGMDLDEDGVFDRGLTAGELKSDIGDGPPIFRHRDTYLSTARIDPAAGRVVVRTHPASDYKQFDLRPGTELADFEFTDLEGRQRRFSELRGKVVLLDFWSTWCAPCVMEMPVLRKIQQDLGGRGFVILGMDVDDDLETHKESVAELDLPWMHATSASVQDIILKRFGVTSFPTHILVDREGRIVSVGDPGQPPLKKESLLATVEEVVSRKPPVEYVGRLEPEPSVERGGGISQKLEPATPELLDALPVPPAPGEKAFAGRMRLLRRVEKEALLVLVEPPGAEPFLYADVDLDGRISAEERFAFEPLPGMPEKGGTVLLRFPVTGGSLPTLPVLLAWYPEMNTEPEERRLSRSSSVFVQGTVAVEGREVKVRYQLSRDTADVNLQGELGMDLDGDGRIERSLVSGETDLPLEQTVPVIFRLGDLYLSTKSVDPAAGRVVLRTHAPAEHRRFDLRPGSQVPDFELTDLEGRPRRLSELRGKVVLLDFWGAWCGGCVEEMPSLRQAYEAYRGQGLEIVGMDWGDKLQDQRKFVAETGLPWLHATAASVEDVIRQGFRVWRFPTKILLDREGRVLAVEEGSGEEAGLLKTLEGALYSSPTSSR